jgi:uncharacterized protein YndB with AHSA1/START domain
MTTMFVTPDQDAIHCEIHIAAPPERVFQALTDPNQLAQWWGQQGRYRLTDCRADIRPGGTWKSRGVDADGKSFQTSGEYLEVDPPRLIVYTWLADWDGGTQSTVRLELLRSGDGTLVKLQHSGFATQPETGKHYSGGWPTVLGWMQSFVEKGETVETRNPV